MTKKLKNIVLILMVLIFITPTTVKLFDGLFHHHDPMILSVKDENHFQEHHKTCPIPNFELSFYSTQKLLSENQKVFYAVDFLINYVPDYYLNNSKYSFLLRAPPILQVK